MSDPLNDWLASTRQPPPLRQPDDNGTAAAILATIDGLDEPETPEIEPLEPGSVGGMLKGCIRPFDDGLQASLGNWLAVKGEQRAPLSTGVWTTDALYRESAAKVEHFRSLGAGAVEMEYAALLQLANTYRTPLAAAFVITDLLDEDWQNGFSSPKVKNQITAAAGLIADYISATSA